MGIKEHTHTKQHLQTLEAVLETASVINSFDVDTDKVGTAQRSWSRTAAILTIIVRRLSFGGGGYGNPSPEDMRPPDTNETFAVLMVKGDVVVVLTTYFVPPVLVVVLPRMKK
jgi:hypothetical protein